MTIKLYNTLKRQKQDFAPLDPSNVRMYVCGPTVYDYAHIGNARPVIVFDILFRLLRQIYGENHVTYVRNITDVDDKINARAAEEGVEIRELTERTLAQFHKDINAVGVLPPSVEPRATEHIGEMIAMIEQLIDKGFAYAAEGHALFEVAKMKDYGALSGRSTDDMLAGARVEVAPYKKDPMDFVLWKPSTDTEPGWDSPWGRGRPGWHIECSAMSDKHLKTPFDIHGGGIDLVFPHHENEIAQSRCCYDTGAMANVWMHNGFLKVEGEIMSKSVGNFITIHELLEKDKFGGRKWSGPIIKLAMLMTHYRQPIDWTVNRLKEAEIRLKGWLGSPDTRGLPEQGSIAPDVITALSDDLNTTTALSTLDQLATASRSSDADEQSHAHDLAATLLWLGLANEQDFAEARADTEDARNEIKAAKLGIDKEEILQKIVARNEARNAKDFAEADRIRDELAAMGITIKDGPEGTTWEVTQ